MTERIGIVGSREHPNLDMVREYVRSLPAGTVVVSGGADGVDLAAEQAWLRADGEVVIFRVCRNTDGKPTIERGHKTLFCRDYDELVWSYRDQTPRDLLILRNTLIVVECARLVCFPDGSKGGSFDAVKQAKRFRRPYEIRWCDGRVVRG